jgi:hypothetical protein
MSKELQTQGTREIERADQGPPTALSLIQMGMSDPNFDVGKLQALVQMEREMRHDAAKVEFAAAKARIQNQVPRVAKNGKIINHKTNQLQNRYALYEDIDLVIRPLMAAEGFAISYDNPTSSAQGMTFTATVSHRLGHVEHMSMTLPPDASGSKNGTQGAVSTSSYARRALLSMWANIITEGADDDGNGGSRPITESQVMEMQDLLDESGRTQEAFLKLANVKKMGDILAKDYDVLKRGLVMAVNAKRNAKP